MKKVLVGGCFDILHPGHITFLEKAKKLGGELIVLLESDEKVRRLKGKGRPVQSQKDRAKVLKALKFVDRVVELPNIDKEEEYDEIIKKIKPDIIGATKGYGNIFHLKRSVKASGAKFIFVTSVVGDYSTSKILNWGMEGKT